MNQRLDANQLKSLEAYIHRLDKLGQPPPIHMWRAAAECIRRISSIDNLASTFWNQGRWKGAEELEAQVMETRKREHSDTLTSMNNLVFTFKSRGRKEDAILLIENAFN